MSDLPRIPNNDGMKQPRHPCYDGIYCKKCGVNIKLLDNFQSIVYNQENNICIAKNANLAKVQNTINHIDGFGKKRTSNLVN